MSHENKYDIQLTVIIYKKKYYISHLAAIALGDKLSETTMMNFGNRSLVEIKAKDKHLIKDYPVYNMDSMLQSFIAPDKATTIHKINKKDCFTFDGMTFISLSKLQLKNKYNLRFSLPAIKIFGTYYILCGKQKDVNTRIVINPE
jgi:hypothetical protein